MKATDEQYASAVVACLGACLRFKQANPDARLKFNLHWCRHVPPNGGVIGGLDQAIACGAAGNSITRRLLKAMNDGTPGGGTIIMAEAAIYTAYGIEHALTRGRN